MIGDCIHSFAPRHNDHLHCCIDLDITSLEEEIVDLDQGENWMHKMGQMINSPILILIMTKMYVYESIAILL